ncbi:MAG: phosphodiester glycosidase family protein, partial [Muribaculaceae bacterium]|nr:phosphodiester glycosidase family protein [Muribaculaceae bacterium]
MKKSILGTVLAAVLTTMGAGATDTLVMLGQTYEVDTLFHNQIGPGVMQTSLWIHNATTTFRFFYATLDLDNPYLSMECIVAADHLRSCNTLDAMVRKHTKEGHRQFVGINGDFFDVSGNKTARGNLTWGSPLGPTVSNGEVFLTRHNNGSYLSFTADTDGQVYVNPFEFGGTLTAPDQSQATVTAVNPVLVSPVNNSITIYNSYYFGSSDAFGGCEVSAKLAPDETAFHATGTTRLVVTSEPSTAGDMDVPAQGFVLHARGTAKSVVENLHPGDELVLETACTVAGNVINPAQVVSGWPRILGNGEVLDTEYLRGDASARHPRTGIGYGDGGKKVYLCVVDGRQYLSAGARTSELATMMRYAGATEGMNLDGGGSSILYTTMLGPRNNPSIGTDRATGNAMFAVYNAPDDNTIAELRFQDYRLSTARYGVYVPHFFGYNQYGLL